VKLKDINELIRKYNRAEASDAEEALINEWYERIGGSEPRFAKGEFELLKNQAYQRLEKHRSGKTLSAKYISLWPRMVAIAAALAAIVFGIWFYNARYMNGRHPEFISGSPLANDIAPGKNTATITLANGKTIILSDAKTGVVIGDELKYNDGSAVERGDPGLRRDDGKGDGDDAMNGRYPELVSGSLPQQLTASTPRGGTYIVTLPDGTKVWLNAASSLKFPSSFGKLAKRIVELNGEGYFEVSKDKSHPFIVKTADQQVEVFGTHFNINSYADEPATKTSLLEGAVGIKRNQGGASALLKPGQQAISTENGIKLVEGVATDAVDWKNGEFIFDDEPLERIMRKVARWYDVEVIYKGIDRNETFGGSISRFENVSKVLENLQLTGGIHFKIEGRKVIVTNQE
jgi:transmembrane sensor